MRLFSLFFTFSLTVLSASAADPHADITKFFATYCIECHGSQKQKADRRYDQLVLPIDKQLTLIELQDAIDQLNLGEMPPKKAKQPTAEETKKIIAQLTETVSAGRKRFASTGATTVLRRLNKREYLNTIGDLFAMDMRMFDPASSMPRDQIVKHLDNIGDALQTSSFLLDQYIDAADKIVEKAFRAHDPIAEKTWTFAGPFKQNTNLDDPHKEANRLKYISVYSSIHSSTEEGSYGYINDFHQGVPADGFYEITINVEAKNRKNPYEPKIFSMDPAEPFRLGIVPGNEKIGRLDHEQPLEPLLSEIIVKDDVIEERTMRVWLDAGFTPRFIFTNGMRDLRAVHGKLLNNYPEELPEELRGKKVTGIVAMRKAVIRYYKLPHIRIHNVTIRGPLYDSWPPEGQKIIFGDRPEMGGFSSVVQRFASRAYRRPATESDINTIMSVVAARKSNGHTDEEVLKDALKAILCSPSFLYLVEPTQSDKQSNNQRLSAYALASRLSYFLWSSLPDEELLSLAANGNLLKHDVLIAQTRRMLAHPHAARLVADFTDSWLNLRALGSMPPDIKDFSYYYSADLEKAMKQETRLFIAHLLNNNRSVVECLNANYTFANRALARHYDVLSAIPPEQAHVFQKITFPDERRGGLLGHASVLTVSANGIETSPVIRGVWIMENILGITPAPPPDNVPPIDPDIRGATTIRDVLKKHSQSPACAECHRKIDPLGFGLENYNPIGSWRNAYEHNAKAKIDASGELFGGTPFKNVVEFKKILVERQELFIRSLTEKMLSYACGRHMEALDRARIDTILNQLQQRNNGMRDLVELIVTSDLFLSK
jgi:cytochrome c553